MHKGIVGRLCPAAASVTRHDRGDNVDKLCKAGDLYAVGIAEKGEKHGADEKSIFKIIDILKKRESSPPLFALPDFLVLLVGVVPNVPLVEGEVDLLLAVLLAFYSITDGGDGMDEIIHIHRARQEARSVPCRVAVIAVKRDIVDILVALVEHFELPGAEGRHLRAGRAAGHDFDGGVDPLHHFGGFVRDVPVFPGCLLPHLPGPVHLVAEAPEFDIEGILLPVCNTHVREFAPSEVVGILHHITRLLGPSRAEVDGIHYLGPCPVGPAGKFMEAHLVGFGSKPGEVQTPGAALNRAYAVFPVEAGDEIPARVADDGNAELLYGFDDVSAETQLVGQWMARLVDAAIDSTAQMFDKGAEKALIHPADLIILI